MSKNPAQKICGVCGKPLNPKRVSQKYHPGECAQEAERERRRVKKSLDSRPRNEYGHFVSQPEAGQEIFEEKEAQQSFNIQDVAYTETKYDGERFILVPLSDLHYGHSRCDVKAIEDYVKWMESREDIFTFLNGDQMENVVAGSKGDIFGQIRPQDQLDYLTNLFSKLAKRGRVIGCRAGNHERRTYALTDFNPAKLLASNLKVPYLTATAFHRFLVGKQEYIAVSEHGSSGSRYPHTKMRAIMRMAETYDADIYISGHTHDLDTKSTAYIGCRDEKVDVRKRVFVNAGHFLDYFDTYADRGGWSPGKKGAAKIKMYKNAWKIHTGV